MVTIVMYHYCCRVLLLLSPQTQSFISLVLTLLSTGSSFDLFFSNIIVMIFRYILYHLYSLNIVWCHVTPVERKKDNDKEQQTCVGCHLQEGSF